MKRTMFSYLTLFLLCLFASCSDDDSPEKESGSELLQKIEFIGGSDYSSLAFDSKGGDKSVRFKVSESWTIKVEGMDASNKWLSVSPQSGGPGESTVVLKASQNEQNEERKSRVSIATVHDKKVIEVSQMQKDALVIAKSSYTVDEKGGDIEIEVGHNVDFDVSIDVDWIKQTNSRSYQTEKLVFKVAENPDYDNREGKITFTSKNGSIKQEVKVYQTTGNALVVSPTQNSFDCNEHTFDIEIKANVEFIVTDPDANWLHRVEGRALTSHTLHYKIDANDGVENREAKIQVKSKDGSMTETVSVLQMQKDALVVAQSEYSLSEKGGKIEVKVGHNVDFDVSIDVDWIARKENNSRAFVTDKLVFEVSENTGEARRIGSITFTSKDKKLTQKVKVVQESKASKNISENYIPVDWTENKLVKCDPKNGIYSFVPSGKNEPQLEKGSVFVVDVDTAAYIAVVRKSQKSGNTVTVETVQGTMCDIFKDVSFTLTTQDMTSRASGSDVFSPVEAFYREEDGSLHPMTRTRANTSFTHQLWEWNLDYTGRVLSEGDHYKLYLEKSYFNVSIDLSMDFNFGGADKVGTIIDGVQRYMSKALEIKASVLGSASTVQKLRADIEGKVFEDFREHNLIKRNIFKPIPMKFIVYGVPVYVVLSADLYTYGWLKAEGYIHSWMGFKAGFEGENGIGWKQEDNSVTPIITHNQSLELIPPTVEGKGTVDMKTGIYPRICTSIYGLIGPTFDIKPFLRDSINGGFHEELLSSGNDYCAWNMNFYAGIDLDAGLRMEFVKGKPEEHQLSKSPLPDEWKKWMYNEKHVYETPVDIELESGNPKDIKQNKPIDVTFKVYDNFYLKKDPKVATPLPQIVKFEGNGSLESKYGIAKNGLVTAHWIPLSSTDSLRAVLYDENKEVIKEAVFKAENKLVILKKSGDGQTGIAGKMLQLPLQVTAYIQHEDHTESNLGTEYKVRFKVVSGGGSVTNEKVNVDRYNVAATSWTLGKSGEQKVEAVIVDVMTGEAVSEPVYFTAQTATLSLNKVSGDGQKGKSNTPLSSPLIVGISSLNNFDAGNDYRVRFSVESGGGSVGSEYVEIDKNNQASTVWTIGENGDQKVRVSLVDRNTNTEIGMPVYFTATVEKDDGPTPGLWIDLGLPSGVKWASHNVGATSPEGYGDYFAWGETSPKTNYSLETYKYLIFYEDANKIEIKRIGKISGNPSYDAATANWGVPARMPTFEECKELVNNCIYKWTTYNGVEGGLLVSRINGNSIFFPSAGYRIYTQFDNAYNTGHYWSSTATYELCDFCDLDDICALGFLFASSDIVLDNMGGRCLGLSVRPVRN